MSTSRARDVKSTIRCNTSTGEIMKLTRISKPSLPAASRRVSLNDESGRQKGGEKVKAAASGRMTAKIMSWWFYSSSSPSAAFSHWPSRIQLKNNSLLRSNVTVVQDKF
ncbi:hypothetical protein J6590_085604 [Homalodisca vitripennis]|nr:hypothetical protein J6590_085604 [Homalodisca vitripennis]